MNPQYLLYKVTEELQNTIRKFKNSGEMKILSELRQRARYILAPILWATFVVYIAYHTFQGDRGLIAFWQLHGQVAEAKQIHQVLSANKERLQKQVNLLNPTSLNADMLEERVRIMLGYSKPGETIIIIK